MKVSIVLCKATALIEAKRANQKKAVSQNNRTCIDQAQPVHARFVSLYCTICFYNADVVYIYYLTYLTLVNIVYVRKGGLCL